MCDGLLTHWRLLNSRFYPLNIVPSPKKGTKRAGRFKSLFPLFRLPVEVLQDVAPHIPSSDLETLALVDRDCRQLARSVQFFNVKFTFSDVSLGILESLLAEMHETRNDSTQALGPCIRHVTVDIGSPLLTETRLAHFPNLAALYKQLPGSRGAQDAYLQALAIVLNNSLPNLESFNWQSRVKIPPELMHSITSSSATSYRDQSWSIESLVLDVEWMLDLEECATATTIMTDMLRAVSPNAADLVLERDTITFLTNPLVGKLLLSRVFEIYAWMRCLWGILAFSHPSCHQTSRVCSLEVSSSDHATAKFLVHRGHLQSMESFSWINQPNAVEEDLIPFIEANPQIHSLSIGRPLPPTIIDTRIIPLLKFDFINLTSLHLVWDSTSIPETSLSVIGNLHRLRKLWISAGSQLGWCNSWKIEHEVLLDTLRSLQQLECLMFSRDSYEVHNHPLVDSSVERYYVNSILPCNIDFQDYLMPDERALLNKVFNLAYVDTSFDQALSLQRKLRKAAWERWHRQKMIKLAKAYAQTFSQLKRCYIGQYPMRVERYELEVDAIIETSFREEHPTAIYY
ncbi:hypothetical protein BT96DRAFT_939049 [Gymnopus androsaceus JB14]|uniref:F-box domain-containing protein n=1 Tax=Gymnopus androsaceus JB14 TaxID=1447944 RepID=A0A6A4HQ58_9AGAR|nr:hypothetical protein BT96DRAFT_939049 [Gymnopus androsaceus JB14]